MPITNSEKSENVSGIELDTKKLDEKKLASTVELPRIDLEKITENTDKDVPEGILYEDLTRPEGDWSTTETLEIQSRRMRQAKSNIKPSTEGPEGLNVGGLTGAAAATPPIPSAGETELHQAAREIFKSDEEKVKFQPVDVVGDAKEDEGYLSRAPNGININRSSVEQFILLNGIGPKTAQTIVDYRNENGQFAELAELRKVPGLGSKTYREMAGLSVRSSLSKAEMRLPTLLGLDTKFTLAQVANASLDKFKLKAMFISSTDGLVLAQSAKDDELMKFAEILSGVAPQLNKRSSKTLKQGGLPESDIVTFYLGKHAVTFAGTDQVFSVLIHEHEYPNPKDIKSSRKLVQELVWYCSYRAVL